jgi:hypothetical protein
MKGLKLSKTSWLILAAGIFIVVLAGLGLTRSQQLKEQTKVAGELDLAQKKLATVQTAGLSQQLESLKSKVDEGQIQVADAKARLNQTVVSVDVADQFFQVAAYCNVDITMLSTTTIAQVKYQGITLSTISLQGTVSGDKADIIKFVIALNDGYVTGNVQSAQVTLDRPTVTETDDEDISEENADTGSDPALSPGTASATISMLIYSYEES